MAYQTLTLSQLQASAENPRKTFHPATIEGLAQSIKTDGLLQNLVVSKAKGKNKFRIIAGERRFRALQLLFERGDIAEDYQISVEFRDDLTEEASRRIATMENVQRENLNPVEECEAIAALLQDGMVLADVAAKSGLSEATLKRRLALSNLCDEAKSALLSTSITLTQAEALTLGTKEQQRDLIENGLEHYDADDIRGWLTDEKANVTMAIFPCDEYTGTYTSDLFASAETTYFDDTEQFLELQRKALTGLADQYRVEGFDPVEIIEGHRFSAWQYQKVRGKKKGGAFLQFLPTGRVEIHTGLVQRKIDTATMASTAGSPFVRQKDTYPAPLRRYMVMHKSLAVQAAILGNPRKAKELVVANKLAKFSGHDCLRYFEQEGVFPPALSVINHEAELFLGDLKIELEEEQSPWSAITGAFKFNVEGAYDAIQSIDDDGLEALLVFLEVCEFGQPSGDRLDTNENSLFNKLARDLGVDMRQYWRPDEGFLKRRSKEQLQQLMNESGASATLANASDYKKGDIVSRLSIYFQKAKDTESPNAEDILARNWLPEAMAFPAIDPDRTEDEVADCEEDLSEED